MSKFKVGDIIKFDTSSNKTLPTTHRLIAIVEEGGTTYYICHGDNVQNVNGLPQTASDWEDDAKFVNELLEGGMTVAQMKQHPEHYKVFAVKKIQEQGKTNTIDFAKLDWKEMNERIEEFCKRCWVIKLYDNK